MLLNYALRYGYDAIYFVKYAQRQSVEVEHFYFK